MLTTWLSLLACKAPVSDYELTLVPVLLEEQAEEILAAEPAIKIRLVYPDSGPELLYAGIARPGEALTLPALPPIPADTLVQLIVESPGGDEQEWNRAATIAYGEAVLTEALALGEASVELSVEIARVDSVGRLSALRTANRRVDAAVAVVDGAAYVFGGGDPGTSEVTSGFSLVLPLISSSTVSRATHTSEGWSELTEVGTIPSFPTELGFPGNPQTVTADRRAGMTATPIEIDGRTLIFVAGGRYTDFPAYVAAAWFLWDPETDTVEAEGELDEERADQLALRLGPNRILVYGGITGTLPTTPNYEIWKSATFVSDNTDHTSDLRTGGVQVAGVELGDDAIVCGGYRITLRDSTQVLWDPSPACHRISPTDDLDDLEDLPIAVGAAALAALPDGGLLLTGGIDQQISEDVIDGAEIIGTATVVPALDRAFRWNPTTDEWREIEPMNTARAHHSAITLSTGQVLILGGNETGSAFFGAVTDPVRCSELFDPETDTFVNLGCSDAARGGNLGIGRGDDDFFVLEGTWYEGSTRAGGGSYGIVRRFPE